MSITPEEEAEWRKVAEEATPARWIARWRKETPANATHIATFDPPTILRLLDELARLRALEGWRPDREEAAQKAVELLVAEGQYPFANLAWPVAQKIADAILALRSQAGWRPIESAPRDGRDVLLWAAPDDEMGCSGIMDMAYWSRDTEAWTVCVPAMGLALSRAQALYTHWMPLPPPPQDNSRDGSGTITNIGKTVPTQPKDTEE